MGWPTSCASTARRQSRSARSTTSTPATTRSMPSLRPSSTGRHSRSISERSLLHNEKIGVTAMADEQNDDDERPCLHCLIVEVVDNFFAEYPVSEEAPDA